MYCREGTGGLCKVKTDYWTVPIKLDTGGKGREIQLDSTP